MTALRFSVNGEEYELDEWTGTPLLWVLQIKLGYLEDVYPCEIDHCGECTIYLDGKAVRACKTPLSQVAGRRITLSPEGAA